jgi:hypothetical protein
LLFAEDDRLLAYRAYVPDEGGAPAPLGVKLTFEDFDHSFGALLDDGLPTFSEAEVDECAGIALSSEGAS